MLGTRAPRYVNFDLLFVETAKGCSVQVTDAPAGRTRPHEVSLEEVTGRFSSAASILREVRHSHPQPSPKEAVQELGEALFRAVFHREVLASLRESLRMLKDATRWWRPRKRLRLRLFLSGVPRLAGLSWAYLYDPEVGYLAHSVEISIVVAPEKPSPIAPKMVFRLRILAVISQPGDLSPVDAEGELARLQEAFRGLPFWKQVEIVPLLRPTAEAVYQCLEGGNFHIFHFIGHGGFDAKGRNGFLIFESGSRGTTRINNQGIAALLCDRRSLGLVVLNCCRGAQFDPQRPFDSVAQSLVRRNIPAVLAMQSSVSNEAAVAFAEAFYRSLVRTGQVDAAVSEGRKAISRLDDERACLEWGLPTLFLHSDHGRIFVRPYLRWFFVFVSALLVVMVARAWGPESDTDCQSVEFSRIDLDLPKGPLSIPRELKEVDLGVDDLRGLEILSGRALFDQALPSDCSCSWTATMGGDPIHRLLPQPDCSFSVSLPEQPAILRLGLAVNGEGRKILKVNINP
jgi:CHAT domain